MNDTSAKKDVQKLQRVIVDALEDVKAHAKRIITHDSSKGSRERAVAEHLASKEATVLISPSMTERRMRPESVDWGGGNTFTTG